VPACSVAPLGVRHNGGSMDLNGAAVVVTGGRGGLGSVICQAFVDAGSRVLAVDVIPPDSGRIIAGLAQHQADTATPEGTQSLVGAALAELGRIDVLVNNAGIGTTKSVIEVEPDEWERVFAVNVRGVYLCTRAVLPGMLERGSGSIVNIASALGLVGVPKRAAYAASKGAVIALTKQVAVEYAEHGIRCNCICPGTVGTEWVDRLLSAADDPAAARRALEDRHPLRRLGTPEQVARATLFLVSDAAAFVTGSALVMDGGQSAR